MKILLTILLSLTAFTFLAQDPTYEQTVDYIKKNTVGRMIYEGPLDDYDRATGHKLTNIVIEKNGRIELITNQKNGIHDFNIVFNIFDLTSSIDYPDGIRAYKYIVHFKGLNVSKGFGITFATENDAIKTARAFRHLKTMCSQEDDLFGKSTEVEKRATLSKAETIEYIKNVVNNQPAVSLSNETQGKMSINGNCFEFIRGYDLNFYKDNSGGGSCIKYYEYKWTFCVDLHTTPFKEIKITERAHFTNYSTLDNYYGVDLITNGEVIACTRSKREGECVNTLSRAQSSCMYKSFDVEGTSKEEVIHIFFKEEADAKRLKKAFEHLSSLINEERNSEKANDPFGG